MSFTVSSAQLKLDRAAKHAADLDEILRKQRPFAYVLRIDTNQGNYSTRARRNDAVAERAALVMGDCIHNLRSALDHAYWERVGHLAINDRERRAVQFPFSETKARLQEAVKNRLADRVSPAFFSAICELWPHGEVGGNEYLYLVHSLDVIDKHKLLTPTGDYTRISNDIVKSKLPPMPNIFFGAVNFGQNRKADIVWPIDPAAKYVPKNFILVEKGVIEEELDINVDVVFAVRPTPHPYSVSPTLRKMTVAVHEALKILEKN